MMAAIRILLPEPKIQLGLSRPEWKLLRQWQQAQEKKEALGQQEEALGQ